jgi:hypothetical protein
MNGDPSPKDYPYWNDVIDILKRKLKDDIYIVQIGVHGEERLNGVDKVSNNLSFKGLKKVISEIDGWVAVDNFFHHFVHAYTPEVKGAVLWGPSSPQHFGYEEQLNLVKDPKYFRPDQFGVWHDVEPNPDAFLDPGTVADILIKEFG